VVVFKGLFLVAIAVSLILRAVIIISLEEMLDSREGGQSDEVRIAIKHLRRKAHHFRVKPQTRRIFLSSTLRVCVQLIL
jgi:hypothetical protein